MIFITPPSLGEPKSSSRKEAKKREGRQDSAGKNDESESPESLSD
jgi:hypothetical protein